MKKTNILILAAAMLLSLIVASCTPEVLPSVPEGQISLKVEIDEPEVITKAFPDSDDLLNENLIKSIDYFIYKTEGDNAIYSGHLDTDDVHEKQFIIDLKADAFSDLFSASDNVDIYAVVNLPEGVTIPANAKLSTVKSAVVTADFLSASQDCFVMSGKSVITRSGNSASGNILVARIAAKISLDITAEESCHEDEEDPTSPLWFSHPEAISLSIVNLVKKAEVQGGASTVGEASKFDIEGGGKRNQYYTYARSWELGATDEPYFFITMPVTKDSFTSSEIADCYYKVVLPNTEFESNHWYKYSIRLKMIGSFEKVNPVVPSPKDAKFFVYRWGGHYGYNGSATEGQITGIRYLEVEGNSADKVYYMYNQDTLKIPYVTSHDCIIIDKSATSLNFSDQDNVTTYNRNSDVKVTIDDKGNIVIGHKINNDSSSSKGYSSSLTTGYEYSPMTITFTIRHNTGETETDAKYSQTIKVVQYPALYIEAQKNTNNGRDVTTGIYVNGSHGNSTGYGNVNGLGGNTNPNMYVITTSFLTNGTMLGDPRVMTVDNLYAGSTNPSASMRTIQNPGSSSTRKMQYYYPTDKTSSASNIIAPKFRIASSYGCTSVVSHDNAEKRCAYYQEDGYPAGRWRLPTKAEIEYINKLSYDEVFPHLFSNSNYWCATGYCRNGNVTETISSSSENYVRCVYDEWYWENTDYPRAASTYYDTPMWGDQLR